MKKLIFLSIFFLVFFSSSIIPEMVPGDDYGHWAYAGDISREVPCSEIETIMIDGVLIFIYRVYTGREIYMKENCYSGGKDCTIGTTRLTYKSGGCSE